MKLAVLSDIHANYPALQAIVDEVDDSVDGYIVAGDMVGLYGFPTEVVQFVIENAKMSVKGNHDISVVEHSEGHVNSEELSDFELKSTHSQLSENQMEWISSLSSYEENENLGIILSHAKPYPEMSSGLEPRNPGLRKKHYTEAASRIDDSKYDFVIAGHTHDQSSLDAGKFGHNLIILNPGSVGQPMDGVAEYAIIDTQKMTVELKQTSFDTNEVTDRLHSLSVPFEWWK